MNKNIRRKLVSSISLAAISVVVGFAADKKATPAELLNRVTENVQLKDIDATWAACEEAEQLNGEKIPNGPEGLSRREKLEFRLAILGRVTAGVDNSPSKREIISLNVSAPGVPVAGMDPKGISDPAVRKEYERRIAENKQKLDKSRRNALLNDLKTKWNRNVMNFVTDNYTKSLADTAEIRSAISSTVSDSSLRTELEQLLRLDEK